jgi:hypothetical protein
VVGPAVAIDGVDVWEAFAEPLVAGSGGAVGSAHLVLVSPDQLHCSAYNLKGTYCVPPHCQVCELQQEPAEEPLHETPRDGAQEPLDEGVVTPTHVGIEQELWKRCWRGWLTSRYTIDCVRHHAFAVRVHKTV